MKLETEQRQIRTNTSDENDINFQISNSPLIFSMLRDKIYSDPIGSICREIISNARDAHSEVGKEDVPIEIWDDLPREIIIRDFGVGMSPDRVQNVYSIYGESSKRNDDSQIGAFGLGAKCPLSYCDSFTVVTFFKNIEYSYLIYIDESQCGKIRLVRQEEKIGAGTTVKIPIKQSDIGAFRTAIKRFTCFLEPQPKFIGWLKARDHAECLLEGTNWKIYKNKELIEWPILLADIPYNYSFPYPSTRPANTTFSFEIGELEVSASREDIRTTEKTKNAIAKAVENYYSEVDQVLEEKLLGITELSDFFELINKINRRNKNREWKTGIGPITYPFSKSVLNCFMGYDKLRKEYTTSADHVKPSSFLILPKDINSNTKWKGIHSRKIRQHIETNNITHAYCLEADDVFLPAQFLTSLDDIKILSYPRNKSATPKLGKLPPDEVVCKPTTGKNKRFKIDRTSDIIYCDNLRKLHQKYGMMWNFPVPVYQICNRAIQLVKGKPYWFTLEEFIEKEIGKLSDSEIKDKISSDRFVDLYGRFDFLKTHIKPKLTKYLERETLTATQRAVLNFMASHLKIEPSLENDFTKMYPLIEHLDRWSDLPKDPLIQYVKLINKETENE